MLDITSQKWIYTEEMANPSGNIGMNQSGQTAEEITRTLSQFQTQQRQR